MMSKLFYRQSGGRHVFTLTTTERKCIGLLLVRSFKTKKTKAKHSIPPTARALEHFDVHYKPHFQDLWPSIRIAFLTGRKSSAVINTYADSGRFEDKFVDLGAIDFVENAKVTQANLDYSVSNLEEVLRNRSEDQLARKLDSEDIDSNDSYESSLTGKSDQHSEVLQQNGNETERSVEIDRKDLDTFMPVQKLYSDTDHPFIEEVTQTVYSPLDMRMDIVKPGRLSLPKRLRVYCFPSGDISRFPNPKIDHIGGYLSFFMMDAASILPVIALDLQEGDSVLDLCAAPGGKSLCIMQTGLAGQLTCNDISKSRLNRLRNIMDYHIPEDSRDNVIIGKADGIKFEGEYDRVLVDAPCNTDRHMLLDDFNNLYSPPRAGERLALPELQKDLLVSAIKCCRVGGSVVYSTCTLAAAQNDGTVQQAFDEIMRTTDIQVVIEDLTELSQIFKETFRFYDGCRLGQLVIPTITANFGPMYICKIKRIK